MSSPEKLTLRRPDDWHLHLRDGAALQAVVGHTAAQFARAIVMPNLRPPVRSVAEAEAYHARIMAALPADSTFQPLMTLYLTDNTNPEEIARALESPIVHAVKYYPAGATTNSDSGVTNISKPRAALEAMAELGLPLLLHGEVTDSHVDVFDREAVFIETILKPLLSDLPDLKIVLEHVTTRQGAEFVRSAGQQVGGTLTAHHLLMNRNAMFQGGIRPHHYCLPILKREEHREALLEAATEHPRFFLGTDSAPHAKHKKEHDCGCAGMYTAHAAMELYAEAFAQVDALDRLEAFASERGPDFYGLPRNNGTITLEKADWAVPTSYPLDSNEEVVPLRAGETLHWKLIA
jgi:dihydroorotase